MALPWLAVSRARFCLSRLAQVSGCLSSSLVSFSFPLCDCSAVSTLPKSVGASSSVAFSSFAAFFCFLAFHLFLFLFFLLNPFFFFLFSFS